MPWSALLGRRLRALSLHLSQRPCALGPVRFMGGGPRTFPGGLNKWQFKRMHEKMAREKERRLLDQEKQLYQARLRSQIRAELAGVPPAEGAEPSISPHGPMSAKEHVKALADRFMKEGAEDLWNEDDGPLLEARVPLQRIPPSSDAVAPLDLRKIVAGRRNLVGGGAGRLAPLVEPLGQQRRHYSMESGGRTQGKAQTKSRWYPDSDSDDSGYGFENEPSRPFGKIGAWGWEKRFTFPRFGSKNGDMEEEEEGSELGDGERKKTKMKMSSAALMNCDRKKVRRVPKYEEEGGFCEEVERIRDELEKRKQDVSGRGEDGKQEESLFTQRRYSGEPAYSLLNSCSTKSKFDEYGISELTLKALHFSGYVQTTVVQDATLKMCLEGKDVLVKARTGTGKSLAFLLPAIETVLKNAARNVFRRLPPILALVLCPTRELASQVAAEANVLLRYHDAIGVQTLIGGTRFKVDQQRLESDPCQIIVATPGRLLDHIENKSGFSARLMGLKLLVLDEADHLLDLGFRKDIEKMVDCLPRMRQSLLFSATIPKEVRRISQVVLKREHVFVNTVGSGTQETPTKILQSCMVAPHGLHFEIVSYLLKEHIMQESEYKVIVFCATSMLTELVFLLLRNMKMNVREMHSRKPQLYRTRISDEFRASKRLILVTSDVSSRGMNYPDVTLVIQVGVPCDREQYIHRLGRTGREGKDGKGVMLLAPWEEYFLDEIRDLPIEKTTLPLMDLDYKQQVDYSMGSIDTSIKEAAYHAWLGYYNSITEIGRDKTTLAKLANEFSASIGLQRPPAIFRRTALKMGLKGVPGIRIRKA